MKGALFLLIVLAQVGLLTARAPRSAWAMDDAGGGGDSGDGGADSGGGGADSGGGGGAGGGAGAEAGAEAGGSGGGSSGGASNDRGGGGEGGNRDPNAWPSSSSPSSPSSTTGGASSSSGSSPQPQNPAQTPLASDAPGAAGGGGSGGGAPDSFGRGRPGSGGGAQGLQNAFAQKQGDVRGDQRAVANDQAAVSSAQGAVNTNCAAGGAGCGNAQTILSAAQQRLARDQSKLQADNQQLHQLGAMMGQLGSPSAEQQKMLGGGGLDPFQSQANGARVSGVNMAPSQTDVAKLTGPIAAPPLEREGAGAPPGEEGVRTAAVVAVPPVEPNAHVPAAGDSGNTMDVPTPRPSPAAEYLQEALASFHLGDYGAALENAQRAINADPNNPLGYLRAAEALNKLGRYVEAEKMAREAIARNPNDARAWKSLSFALLKQGKYKEALAAALEAARLKPDMAEAWTLAAFASEKLGDRAMRNSYLAQAAQADHHFEGMLHEALAGKDVFRDDVGLDSVEGEGRFSLRRDVLAAAAALLCALAYGFLIAWRRRRNGFAASWSKVAIKPAAPQ